MDTTELKALTKIEGRLVRLEAMQESAVRSTGELTSNINRLVEKLERSEDIAREAEHQAKSAHHRVDESNKRVNDVEADIKWLWRTVIATIITAWIGGAIALLWKGVGP